MDKTKNFIEINKKEFDFDKRLLSEIMTDKIDEFNIIEKEKNVDLFEIGDHKLKLLMKHAKSNDKDDKGLIDPIMFVQYQQTLKEVYSKAGENSKQELHSTMFSTQVIPECANYASIPVFQTMDVMIGKYERYIEANPIAYDCAKNHKPFKRDGLGGKTIVLKDDLLSMSIQLRLIALKMLKSENSEGKNSKEQKSLGDMSNLVSEGAKKI